MARLSRNERSIVRSEMKTLTEKDVCAYRKLRQIFKEIQELENQKKLELGNIARLEKKALAVIKQIKKDAILELNWVEILKPKTVNEKAILEIFGPFGPPEEPKDARPIDFRKVMRWLKKEGCGDFRNTSRGHYAQPYTSPLSGDTGELHYAVVHGGKEIKKPYIGDMFRQMARIDGLEEGSSGYNNRIEHLKKGARRLGLY